MNPLATIEAILFVASKPLRISVLVKACALDRETVTAALETLAHTYEEREAGIRLAVSGDTVQLVSAPECADVIAAYETKELTGELTKAQLETLTVVAYQGPMTRPEIEDIRGVNCAVILRTLLLRGLITEAQSQTDILPVYELSIDALRMLGITNVRELPEYDALHAHPHLDDTSATTDDASYAQ